MTIRTFTAAAAISVLLAGAPAAAQEVVIGLSGALTGPAAGSYAPAIEGLRLYVDKVNSNGGVAGRKIKLIMLDDQGEASKGAANATKLISQDNVALLINSSLSSTFAPMIAATSQAEIPLLFAASPCPKEVFPPANPLLFCTTAFASKFDSQATLDFIAKSGGNVSLGLVAMAIPISRSEIESAEGLATVKGMKVADKAIIPPPTPDYTPFATKLSEAKANWVYAWAPWVTQVRTFESLRKIGWSGSYIAWAHLESESELARLKDPSLFAIGANALFVQDLPVQREIQAVAKAAGATYPAHQMTEGWIAGMVLEAALSKAGSNANAKAIQAAMQNLSVDTKGLRGGPIEWTASNHFRQKQFYRIYRWAPASSAIEVVQDWTAYDVK